MKQCHDTKIEDLVYTYKGLICATSGTNSNMAGQMGLENLLYNPVTKQPTPHLTPLLHSLIPSVYESSSQRCDIVSTINRMCAGPNQSSLPKEEEDDDRKTQILMYLSLEPTILSSSSKSSLLLEEMMTTLVQ